MLKIKDSDGRTKYLLKDEDEEPISIDELVIRESEAQEEQENKSEKKSE